MLLFEGVVEGFCNDGGDDGGDDAGDDAGDDETSMKWKLVIVDSSFTCPLVVGDTEGVCWFKPPIKRKFQILDWTKNVE